MTSGCEATADLANALKLTQRGFEADRKESDIKRHPRSYKNVECFVPLNAAP